MAEHETPLCDGAGPVFRRVFFVVGLASLPTALVDLNLVHGTARTGALALALAVLLVGVGSLYRTRPASRERARSHAPLDKARRGGGLVARAGSYFSG